VDNIASSMKATLTFVRKFYFRACLKIYLTDRQ